jgi:hypothetical protein
MWCQGSMLVPSFPHPSTTNFDGLQWRKMWDFCLVSPKKSGGKKSVVDSREKEREGAAMARGDYHAWWDQLLAPFGGTGGCCDSRDDHVCAVLFHLNI